MTLKMASHSLPLKVMRTTNILKLIGADNVMSGLGVDKTWAKIWETVIAQNPDYIIIADYGTLFVTTTISNKNRKNKI